MSQKQNRKGPFQFGLLLFVSLPVAAYLFWTLSNEGKFSFLLPWALLMLVAGPLAYWVSLRVGQRRRARLHFSNTAMLSRMKVGFWGRFASLPAILRVVALLLIVVALARPQTRERGSRVEVEGIDIVVALDLSNSMEAQDMQPNRLQAAKAVIDNFVGRRQSDRLGMVVFGREAYTHCPLTLDYSVLRNMLADIELGLIDGSGTAIGNALGVSLARLRKSDAKSRVVILLTDGDNNSGNVTPKQAARYAQAMKVKVFTILIGSDTMIQRDLFGRTRKVKSKFPINPKLLQEIASSTGGQAYRATDERALAKNFEQILNELDKSTRKDVAAVYTDAHRPFVGLALFLLLFEAALLLTRFRQFP